jgi:intein-encoded DNA endonuclease-like protein
LKPSEELAYVIAVRLGDGCVWKKGDDKYAINLKAKDKEFVEEFARCLAKVLGRKPIKVRYVRYKIYGMRHRKYYTAQAISKTLYELLREPIDLNRIKKYVEHCLKCTAAFLKGLFHSEGCISKDGYITLYNSNYELLEYAKKLLRRFGIEATGPHDAREGYYYIYVLTSSNADFYKYIGFTIKRKQQRLEEYLRKRRARKS